MDKHKCDMHNTLPEVKLYVREIIIKELHKKIEVLYFLVVVNLTTNMQFDNTLYKSVVLTTTFLKNGFINIYIFRNRAERRFYVVIINRNSIRGVTVEFTIKPWLRL